MITGLTQEAAMHIAHNLREADRKEALALHWSDSTDETWQECMIVSGPKYACLVDGRPAVMGGVALHTPGVGQAWVMGTNEFDKCKLEVTRFCIKAMRALFKSGGLHRIQAFSAADHYEAHAWLESLGFEREGIKRKYGKDGSDYIEFVRLKGD